ncbi:response regulator receiver and Hpt phospho transfer protein [Solidesulfovibrio fructosivorans JJ]]|uniref:Response regulator receiver and Hpt phospho transfer protein n=1 Tax=Solidesulfovibrio fructosivorans JJ] TaxID=596151 RepID=E1JZV6_SOLFR|nr:response regulator [Solidesulfovibrio fructosivorans]EFL50136.1 response regulator receiver and Hpt phospho transfer protein [Solidesulfovibrio fructosivorans JJ]]
MRADGPDQAKSSLSVLVVDDNDINQLYMQHLLRKLGHEAVAAYDGRQALDALASQRFDIILMDVQLPDNNGLDLTRIIRDGKAGTANAPDIPILATTAFALSDDRARCLEAGMNDHLPKPLRAETLRQALEDWSRAPAGNGSGRQAPFDLAAFTRESRREFATEMLALFLELAEPRGRALRQALEDGNLEAAVAAAHDLAGMAGPIRANRLHESMKAVQEACLTGDLDLCRAIYARADSELDAVLGAVRAHPYLLAKGA